MSELKLLNCPFCGGEVVISDEKIDATREVYNFHCHNCDMVTFYDFPNDKEKAIETWNTRTPMDNIMEKLKELKKPPFVDTPYHTGFVCGVNYSINIVKQEINNGLE